MRIHQYMVIAFQTSANFVDGTPQLNELTSSDLYAIGNIWLSGMP